MKTSITSLLIYTFVVSVGFARKVGDWSYERLFKEADLVMIGSVEGWGSAKAQQWSEKIFEKARFEANKTAFTPLLVLKGEPAFVCTWLLHFSYKKGATPYNDGPSLVSFLKKPLIIEVKPRKKEEPNELKPKRAGKSVVSPPEYLLFLKQRKDGMYEPVSGQLDAAFSVRALFPPNHVKIP
jgi:hypothetical protein